MAWSAAKKQRREYRRAIKARGKIDRFTERMEALGGSGACACCTLIRPLNTLQEGVCPTCRSSLVRLRKCVPVASTDRYNHAEMGVVWADASFRDGIAGLAVCGALGEHYRQVEASTSTHAEVLALRWAREIARAADIRDLTFRTDCQAAYKQFGEAPKGFNWIIEQVPRSKNQRADYLAGRARIAI